MKELTIEEKAKRYDEALKIAKDVYTYYCDDREQLRKIESIFPELVESEDERIKKEIIDFICWATDRGCITKEQREKSNSWLSWLEKQSEHANFRNKIQIGDKVTRNEDGVLVNLSQLKRVAKPADKVEPKFHKGDWVVQGCNILKIRCVGDEYYCFETVGGYVDDMLVSEIDSLYHLWTIQDAKAGDVLVSVRGTFIFSQEHIAGKPEAYCGLMNGLFIKGNGARWTNKKCYPATKEQRDLLFQKMKEAGYEWDADEKKLKKIEQKPQRMVSAEAKEAMYAKPAWSEEDECNVINICSYLRSVLNDEAVEKYRNWLKSLRPQKHWKPSDEQMEALDEVYKTHGANSSCRRIILNLLNDLKKLKDEK